MIEKKMKNIQIIDDDENCKYSIFSIEDELFDLIFPNGQNLEFFEDYMERTSISDRIKWDGSFFRNPVKKDQVDGIHGILFYHLKEKKGKYYPNKRFSDDNTYGSNHPD